MLSENYVQNGRNRYGFLPFFVGDSEDVAFVIWGHERVQIRCRLQLVPQPANEPDSCNRQRI